ncbi:hypothetical protein Tco_0864849, partial [Tanacetum coccineum]
IAREANHVSAQLSALEYAL